MSKIAIISGTNRPGSNTAKIAAHLDVFYRALGQPTVLIDLAALPPEIFAPTSYAEKPASFAPFSDAVLASAGLHVVTPEYNGSFPGVLKYFIDMLKFPESFESRPVCFTGVAAGIWGALRSTEQLGAIFAYRNAYIYPERVFLPQINNHMTSEGRLGNEELLARLRSQAQGFVKFTSAFAPKA
jgi:chromate reductase, NAD(P)H dehydrogenase (quinone)